MRLLVLMLLISAGCLQSAAASNAPVKMKAQHISEIRRKAGSMRDSVDYIKLLYDLKWKATIVKKDGSRMVHHISIPDTIALGRGELLKLETAITLDTSLIHKILSLYYEVKGSLLFRINGSEILATGYFGNDTGLVNDKKKEGYHEFYFTDNLNNLEIYYLPGVNKKSFHAELRLGETIWKEQRVKEEKEGMLRGYFSGAFHVAFAAIFFIIFLFFREGVENLYFSFYALIVGLFCILQYVELPPSLDLFLMFSSVIALELLSVFLARVILNRKKSLLMMCIIVAVAVLFSFYEQFKEVRITEVSVALMIGLVLILFVIYEIISILFYLIQGFSQKRWEAKAITWGFFIGIMLLVAIFILAIIFSVTFDRQIIFFINYTPYLAMITLLITMSIVLGRRNGENQLRLLAQVREIEALSVENLAREKEKKQFLENQNTELERKVIERTGEVTRQKEIIETKNKEITDNLRYAKRIQSAILPDNNLIRKTFPGFFACYIPRDIVSGDYYSFSLKDNRALISVADCTGHGVSGAFMSMIGISLLHQVVNERSITEPAMVLEELNREVIHSLKQRYSDSNDGMDIAFCNINLAEGYLDFAGANRPLWIVRDKNLLEFRPDKFPIGGLQFSQLEKFTSHHIPLAKGDILYMTTDGFADQFGGVNGKKLMTKKLKEVLVSISHLEMKEQEAFLYKYFDEWKGREEQVDDVLVVGVRI